MWVSSYRYLAGLVSIPCILEKDCNGNPISTFPPCYAFQMIITVLAPRLIQSISRNVHNKNRALKQLWLLKAPILELKALLLLLLKQQRVRNTLANTGPGSQVRLERNKR